MNIELNEGSPIGLIEEIAWQWGLNLVYDGDSGVLKQSEEDWISEMPEEDEPDLPLAA